ncbi:MAG TPA: hypothetical protein VFM79_00420 [Pelobium sp.]|nr:hypothetical protein [Pelobium sp.]
MKIKINGTYIKFFDEVAVTFNLGSVASVFSFVGRFNPDNPLHIKVFKPLSFSKVEIFSNDDELLLTGTMINHDFNSDARPQLWVLSGYSLPGILEDVNIPYDQYPLESLKRNLKDITEKLISTFGINLVVDGSVSQEVRIPFDKSVADPSESIKEYLSKIAGQRNIVMSHNEKGDLLYFRPDTKALPKMRFNVENTLSMAFSVKGQALHSDVTVLRQPSDENSNISPVDTVKNVMVNQFRPAVKVLSSGTDTATKKAADNELAAELQNITLKIEINKLLKLKPGNIVEVKNEEIFLFEYTRFMISSIALNEKTSSESSSLSLVLPESFTGETPKNIFS